GREHRDLPSFPTRRSSDLIPRIPRADAGLDGGVPRAAGPAAVPPGAGIVRRRLVWFVRVVAAWAAGMAIRLARRLARRPPRIWRSEEHTSELQSRGHLVCR